MKALLESYAAGDDDRFYSVAMQVASHEAKLGHGNLARELRDLIDSAKARRSPIRSRPFGVFVDDSQNMLRPSCPKLRLADLTLSESLLRQIQQIVREQRHASRLLEHGLSPRRKLLFLGPPGTGKRRTASVLAGELGLPFFDLQFAAPYTRSHHDALSQLEEVFRVMSGLRGVYLFDRSDHFQSWHTHFSDEDSILVDGFLTMLKRDNSHSILVLATDLDNGFSIESLGYFDAILEYQFPTELQIAELLQARLRHLTATEIDWRELGRLASGLSYSEISATASDILKEVLMSGFDHLNDAEINSALIERKAHSEKLRSYDKSSGRLNP